MTPVIFADEARVEALDSFHWYESRRRGLGDVVIVAVFHGRRNPDALRRRA